MKPIYNFQDYRKFLLEFYEDERNKRKQLSYRDIAKMVQVDHSYLIKVLQKKAHIADKDIPSFISLCGLKNRDAEYFKLLVRYNKSKNLEDASHTLEKMKIVLDVENFSFGKEREEIFSVWYHSVILALLKCYPLGGDVKTLAKRLNPAVDENRVAKSLVLLEKLNLIRKNGRNKWIPSESFIATEPNGEAPSVRGFQLEMMELAKESIEINQGQHPEAHTMTFAIDKSELMEIGKRILALKQSIRGIADDSSKPDSVYQLNIVCFPLTTVSESRPFKQIS